jgi:hypothetical protein
MPLIIRRASISRSSGRWSEEDYDLVYGDLLLGRLMQLEQARQ